LARETQAIARTLSGPGSGLSGPARARLRAQAASVSVAVAKVPASPEGDKPFTLGIGEPFTTTLTVALYFALVLSLPIILFEMYGFVLPALKPRERRVAMPLVMAVPFLFAVGVVFGYFVVLPAAVRFFQNFNSAEFNVVVQANQYYRFAGTVLLAMGLVFQVPVAIIGATRLGVVTPKTLRKHRRYALLACAAIAAFLPGDAVTMVLETVPLYLLYELSIVLASLMERRDSAKGAQGRETGARAGAGAAAEQGAEQGGAGGGDAGERSEVERIIDHVDERL
jgi:sec-independent protein translocase protein TatC